MKIGTLVLLLAAIIGCTKKDLAGSYQSIYDSSQYKLQLKEDSTYLYQYSGGKNPERNTGRWSYKTSASTPLKYVLFYRWKTSGHYSNEEFCPEGCDTYATIRGDKLIFVDGFDELNFEKE